jgi:uncharacterized protein (DUF1501 family)
MMPLYCEPLSMSRRQLLAGAGAFVASAHLPRFAQAAGGRDPRLVVIILRGALDGLSAVGPIGDPDYVRLHGKLSLSLTGDHAALPLDGSFALNPAMPNFARLYKAGQATVIHAVATSYRERSHFDGQDVLESGYAGAGKTDSGWLNRAIAALPAGERVNPSTGLGVGSVTPLIMRGSAPVLGWAPHTRSNAGADLASRVLDLYTHRDPLLATALRAGLDTDRMAAGHGLGGDAMKPRGGMSQPAAMRQAAHGAARIVAADDGPRIAALAFDGWDTHANEGGASGQLANRLSGLDGAFEEFENGLGETWKDTTIAVVTEFGRTVRINGAAGTDHGTGTVAFLAGGAVKGGRMIADWPGLADRRLHEGRDLRPTTDLRAVLKGLLADQFGLSNAVLAETVFPDSGSIKPMNGLIA